MYLGIFAVMTMVMQVGESSTDVLIAQDVNDATSFQVDKLSSGSGFFGTVRSVTDFFTDFLPKAVSFNYSFMGGDLEVIRWFLISVFGGLAVMVFSFQMLGVLRRNL